ncbi:MAG: hypothetical protein ABWW69_06870 [Pyrodictiaceae archaeon]
MERALTGYYTVSIDPRELESIIELEIRRIRRKIHEATISKKFDELGEIAINILIIDLLAEEQGLTAKYAEKIIELKKAFRNLLVIRETSRIAVRKRGVKRVRREYE